MTDAPNETLYAEEISSFRGMIYMLKNGREIPLRLSRAQDKFTWGVTPEDGWLQAGGNQEPPLLTFNFHSQTEDRLHFNISRPGQTGPQYLGISRNGYLGLYEHAEVTDYWKLEPLEWTEKGLICRWRDHQGHQVKAIADTPHLDRGQYFLLNVTEGETHRFLIRRID
ncbi:MULTISPECIES: hypothetical protein [Pseudomonas]|uniref:Uncharacterized protein n=1 Tax=Pseudomonas auratipiscis TaxID=3115853 RepID=A0AB35WZ07_9PSED|nr:MULTISPECIES: hypothetical protein [unclassified Pseudomonas]MEE1869906.1 hypothetical protein [Pseudomonas sp. 120P]MEE1960979.1 hypothetical protein [Pseudomonas sp. 119P]